MSMHLSGYFHVIFRWKNLKYKHTHPSPPVLSVSSRSRQLESEYINTIDLDSDWSFRLCTYIVPTFETVGFEIIITLKRSPFLF